MKKVGPFDPATNAATYGDAAFATWSNGNPATGTEGSFPPHEALTHVMEEIAYCITQAGLTEDETDLTQLWQAFQALINFDAYVSKAAARAYLAIYPEILTTDGRMTITTGTGTVIVAADQSFVHRGVLGYSTNDTDVGDRTLAHLANKTYHLRWQYNAGSPVYVLKDLADGAYNPSVLDEGAVDFDTTFDDMILARVVTDGSNVPTITTLANKHRLRALGGRDTATIAVVPAVSVVLDWARDPSVALRSFSIEASGGNNEIPYYMSVVTSRYGGPVDVVAYTILPEGSALVEIVKCEFQAEFWA